MEPYVAWSEMLNKVFVNGSPWRLEWMWPVCTGGVEYTNDDGVEVYVIVWWSMALRGG